ncbi:MAG: hypothetical protein U0414_24115 [Polyangiaceae bacterium]
MWSCLGCRASDGATPGVRPSPPPSLESAAVSAEASAVSASPSSAPSAEAAPPPPPQNRFVRRTLEDEIARPIELYPPIDPRSAPLVVALHATCMEPASVCDWFGRAGREHGWLVCPAGHGTCNDAPDWSGPSEEKAHFLEQDLETVEAEIKDEIDGAPGVLFGWSRGAYAACDILRVAVADPSLARLSHRFHGLVLMAARVRPDDATLRAAGIDRIVLASGDQDAAAASMQASRAALARAGFEARYVSLGPIPHQWPDDFEARMREHIAWALEPRERREAEPKE